MLTLSTKSTNSMQTAVLSWQAVCWGSRTTFGNKHCTVMCKLLQSCQLLFAH